MDEGFFLKKKLEQLRYPAMSTLLRLMVFPNVLLLLLWEIYGVLSSIDMDVD